MESGIFLYAEARLERAECSAHYPNIRQQPEGVKKEQVKGCGSVNRPTPGSQRPAEPVATGFLEGVKISKNRGQILGLWVKLWVVDVGLSQCRAILYGVTIGVVANFGHFFASRVAGGFLAHIAVDGGQLFLFSLHIGGQGTSKFEPHKQRIGP